MTPEQQAPLVLEAMTLRGIGSYLHGARLEIKPLTILCGENGSGKSTWLKALNILEKSLDTGRLPFGFELEDWDPHNLQHTNAFYHLAEPAEFAQLNSDSDSEQFGPPGTIGIEMRASRDGWLTDVDSDDEKGTAWNFLRSGQCLERSTFRLRFAHPTYRDDSAPTPELFHLVELQLDGKHTIRMVGERDPPQKFEEGFSRPRRSKPYTLSCSMSFVTGSDNDAGEMAAIATVTDLLTPRVSLLRKELNATEVASFISAFEKRIRQLLGIAIKGYFYVGAVREPYTSLSIQVTDQPSDSIVAQRRHVGAAGEYAWRLERCFGSMTMRRILETNFKTARGMVAATLLEARGPKLVRVWERADSDKRKRLEDKRTALDQIEVLPAAECVQLIQETSEICADLLNQLLDDRGLFDAKVWARIEEICHEGNPIGQVSRIDDPEILALVEQGVDQLTPAALRRLNYLLIIEAFWGEHISSDEPPPFEFPGWECQFQSYLSWWLHFLVNVTLNSPEISKLPWRLSHAIHRDGDDLDRPTLFLLEPDSYSPLNLSQIRLARLSHPCFGANIGIVQPPRQLSAGFHQLFPIMVQLGVMRFGELIGIENPEVHLHPSLQLRVTEALLDHARSGRRILVETHSDLVIRRVIRAILEEQIAQSQVQIYFAGLSEIETMSERPRPSISFSSSKLDKIQFDEQGRIANWPPGFLSDDVQESQRLMDIMYGNVGPEPSDDEQF